jgi:hypothetical protein
MRFFGLRAVLLACLVLPAAAAEDDDLQGSVEIGYRNVEVNGNEDKYREDVNFGDDALRLFGLDIDYRPAESRLFDSLTLEASDLGGEPHESARFRMSKVGRYDLSLRYRRTEYFYRDAGYFFRSEGDLHSWDTARDFVDLKLKVETTDWLTLRFGADSNERDGRSTTSRYVQRDVFVLDSPVDQKASSFWAAADFRWGWADITVEQRSTRWENRWLTTTSGNSGTDPGEPSSLNDYRQLQTTDADAPITLLSFRGSPLERFRFLVEYAHVDAELDHDTDGDWDGIDFTGQSFQTTLTNTGRVRRTSDLWDVEASILLLPRIELTIDYTRRSYEQDGSIDSVEVQSGGAEQGTYPVQGETLSVAFGAGRQERTSDFELSGPAVETTRALYRAGLRWRPNRIWDFRLDLEQGNDDNPLTPISPTSEDRIRFRANVTPIPGLALSLNFLDRSLENDESYPLGLPTDDTPPADEISLAEFDVTTWGLVLTWSGKALDLTAGYNHADVNRNAHIVFVTGSTFVPAFDVFTTRGETAYLADTDVFHGAIAYRFGAGWSVGARAVIQDNAGSFPVGSDVYGAWVRYLLSSGLFFRVNFDRYDYDEDNPFAGDPVLPTPDVNDYDAELWTFSVGYRF